MILTRLLNTVELKPKNRSFEAIGGLWFSITFYFLSLVSTVAAVWPLPRQFSTGTTPLGLAPSFSIDLSKIDNPPRDLRKAALRTTRYLRTDRLQALVVDGGASSAPEIYSAKQLQSLSLFLTSESQTRSIADETVDDLESRDEAYVLTIPVDGSSAELKANSTLGLFRGLTTFGQLWYDWKGSRYTLQAPIQAIDAPVYPYRGFMLDTSRNYFPVHSIKRTLDAMSWVKINTFHWHVVDSQSFPLIVPDFTELSENGAYSPSQVYSPRDVRDIIDYAAARGIDVMVEIDTPGHTSVIAASHPEHIACFQATPWADFANEPPAGQLRIASATTVDFAASLIESVASMLPSKLFSTGGDEINKNCYSKDSKTQADLNSSGKTIEQALNTFTQATHGKLKTAGKTPVVWEEMILNHNVTLSNDTIAMVWVSSANAAAVAQKGFRIIHAPSDYFYLDCGAGEWVGNNTNGNSWCDPFKTWQKAYSFNPNAGLAAQETHLVLGGQQLLWTEQSGPSNLDSIVWPRAAASAEVFWSGPGGDGQKALPRLHDLAFRFMQRGVRAIPLQPRWCALRPGACDLTA